MAAKTALALCGVGVRLGVRLVMGRRCSVKGNAIAELNMTSRMVYLMARKALGKSVAVREIIVK